MSAKPENERDPLALEPCPFCGPDSDLVFSQPCSDGGFGVTCRNCHTTMDVRSLNRASVAAAWNRRAQRESGEPVAWLGVCVDGNVSVTTEADTRDRWVQMGRRITPLGPIDAAASQDLTITDAMRDAFYEATEVTREGSILRFDEGVRALLAAREPSAGHRVFQALAEPVAEAGSMPGTDGFTMAVFKASDVPIGTKVYVAAPPAQAEAQARIEALEVALKPFADAGRKIPVEQSDASPGARVNADGSCPGTFTTIATGHFRRAVFLLSGSTPKPAGWRAIDEQAKNGKEHLIWRWDGNGPAIHYGVVGLGFFDATDGLDAEGVWADENGAEISAPLLYMPFERPGHDLINQTVAALTAALSGDA